MHVWNMRARKVWAIGVMLLPLMVLSRVEGGAPRGDGQPRPGGSAGTGAQAGGDEAAVRRVVQQYVDAREVEDESAVGRLFTSDADQLTSSGEWRRGRAEIVRGTRASSQRTGGKRTITIETIRFPAPGVALADGRYELSGLAGNTTRQMWTSLLLTRGADGWQIAAIRNMLPAAAPPATTR